MCAESLLNYLLGDVAPNITQVTEYSCPTRIKICNRTHKKELQWENPLQH